MEESIVYENKTSTPNEVGVMDDIGISMIKKQVENMYAEEDAFTKGLDNAEKTLDNYLKQWLIDSELAELQIDNFGLIEDKITYKVHLLPRFWELQKEQFAFKYRAEKFQAEQYIESLEKEVSVAKDRLKVMAEGIAEKIDTLTKLGEEIPSRT